MRIILVLFVFVFLNAYEIAKIVEVNNKEIKLDKNIKLGISGIVLCPYEKEDIICARAISYGNKAKLFVYDNLKNDAFALPIVYPKKGDTVIFGKNYTRIVIIAPNQETYLSLKDRFKNFNIIPIDVFAAFLDEMPTSSDFVNFAKEMDIGMYIFALDKLYFVDAISLYVINKEDFEAKKFKLPFYSSYNFGIKNINAVKYYKKILKGF